MCRRRWRRRKGRQRAAFGGSARIYYLLPFDRIFAYLGLNIFAQFNPPQGSFAIYYLEVTTTRRPCIITSALYPRMAQKADILSEGHRIYDVAKMTTRPLNSWHSDITRRRRLHHVRFQKDDALISWNHRQTSRPYWYHGQLKLVAAFTRKGGRRGS